MDRRNVCRTFCFASNREKLLRMFRSGRGCKSRHVIGVQAKYQKSSVPPCVGNKLRGVLELFKRDNRGVKYSGMIVTNALFTKAAVSQASNDIELIDGPKLIKLIS